MILDNVDAYMHQSMMSDHARVKSAFSERMSLK